MATYRLKGTAGALMNQTFVLEQRLLIGRADDCDLRIDDDALAPHHAEITLVGDGQVLLRDLGSDSGSRVNGQAVTETALYSGDEIQVARSRFMLQAPGLRPERVLTTAATEPRRAAWPWLLPLAFGLAAALAWQQGLLEPLLALLQR